MRKRSDCRRFRFESRDSIKVNDPPSGKRVPFFKHWLIDVDVAFWRPVNPRIGGGRCDFLVGHVRRPFHRGDSATKTGSHARASSREGHVYRALIAASVATTIFAANCIRAPHSTRSSPLPHILFPSPSYPHGTRSSCFTRVRAATEKALGKSRRLGSTRHFHIDSAVASAPRRTASSSSSLHPKTRSLLPHDRSRAPSKRTEDPLPFPRETRCDAVKKSAGTHYLAFRSVQPSGMLASRDTSGEPVNGHWLVRLI